MELIMLLLSLSDGKPVDSMFTVWHVHTTEMAVSFCAFLFLDHFGEAVGLDTYFL